MQCLVIVLLVIFLPLAVGLVLTGSLGFVVLLFGVLSPVAWATIGGILFVMSVIGLAHIDKEAREAEAVRAEERRKLRGSGWLP